MSEAKSGVPRRNGMRRLIEKRLRSCGCDSKRGAQCDLCPILLLELLHSMLLIFEDGRRERHGMRHAKMREGDNERLSFLRRNHMAHDPAFIAGIRHVRDDLPST